MNQTTTAIDELWVRLAALFGAEHLDRKYGATPPQEWRVIVNRMPHVELERGMRRLLHSGRSHAPSLPEFVKLCRAVGDDSEHGGPKAAPALPAPSRVTDSWGSQANMHLLAYTLSNHAQFRGGIGHGRQEPSWLIARTEILVRWKNEWARLMRESDHEDREDGGKALWQRCMGQAEAEIRRTPAAMRPRVDA